MWRVPGWVMLAACLGAFSSAHAATAPTKTSLGINWQNLGGGSVVAATGSTISVGAGGRNFNALLTDPTGSSSISSSGDNVHLTDRTPGPGPRSPALVASTRVLTKAALARGLARALPVVGTALTIADLLESLRCQEGFGGGAECDLGTPQQQVAGWQFPKVNAACQPGAGSSPAAAAAAAAGSCTVVTQGTSSGYAYTRTVTYSSTGCNASNVCAIWFHRTEVFPQRSAWNTSMSALDYSYQATSATTLQCPTVAVPAGGTVVSTPGVDGKCPTLVYTPMAETPFVERVIQYGSGALGPTLAREVIERGAPVEHVAPSHQVESPPQSDRRTIQNPDGSTTVRDTEWPWVQTPEGYGWGERITERTYPPGSTPPPLGQPAGPDASPPTITETPGPSGGSGGGGSGTGTDPVTCGLPGTPPCKIDESGMPPDPPPNAFDPVDDPVNPLRLAIENPQVADLDFTWSFQLPAACSVISLGEFAGRSMSFDMCRHQPMIHDIMTMVWAVTGVLAAWGMLSRTMGGG